MPLVFNEFLFFMFSNSMKKTNIYSMTTSKDDFDAIQNDVRIQSIEKEKIITIPGDEYLLNS